MSAVEVSPVPSIQDTAGDDEDHWHCCVNDKLALCGKELDETFKTAQFDEASCIVCEDLVDSDFCPMGFKCPAYD